MTGRAIRSLPSDHRAQMAFYNADGPRRCLEADAQILRQAISFTDSVSFVLMRREGIKRALSFDKHFRHAGFALFD